MLIVAWTMFFFVSGGNQISISGFNNEAACERTKKEITLRLRPRQIACVPIDFGEPEKK